MTQYDPPGPRPVMDYALQPKRSRGIFGWIFFIGLTVLVFLLMRGTKRPADAISLSDFDMLLRSGSVRTVTVTGDQISGDLWAATTLPNGKPVTAFSSPLPTGMGASFDFMQYLLSNRGRASVNVANDAALMQVVVPLIPWVVIVGIICFSWLRTKRSMKDIRSTTA